MALAISKYNKGKKGCKQQFSIKILDYCIKNSEFKIKNLKI